MKAADNFIYKVRRGLQPRNMIAFGFGGVMGGFAPFASYTVSTELKQTYDGTSAWWGANAPKIVLTAGALGFSAITVYKFGKLAFKDRVKAGGFVAATEMALIFGNETLRKIALGILVGINTVETGDNIAGDRRIMAKPTVSEFVAMGAVGALIFYGIMKRKEGA